MRCHVYPAVTLEIRSYLFQAFQSMLVELRVLPVDGAPVFVPSHENNRVSFRQLKTGTIAWLMWIGDLSL